MKLLLYTPKYDLETIHCKEQMPFGGNLMNRLFSSGL